MKIYFQGDTIEYDSPAIALGNFDGMHAGHLHIIEAARKIGGSVGVLLFENHTSHLTGGRVNIITPLYDKLRILSEMKVDFVYLVNFDADFMRMDCAEFAGFLNKIGVRAVSVGYDYRFGRKAAGDTDLLRSLLNAYGIKTVVSDAVNFDGEPVKSSRIRTLITKGRIIEANRLMTRPFRMSGIVEHGFQNGRKLGFPTANLEYANEFLLPQDGVYYGECLVDKKRYRAIVNVGKNPTFEADTRTVEAHIINYDNDLYGCRISIEFFEKIRDDMRFESLDALKNQLSRDKKYALERKSREDVMDNFFAVVLAAGMGTRMKSEMPKVLHKVCGKPLAGWVIEAAKSGGALEVCTVVGHKADDVKAALDGMCSFAVQTEQKGTGHAVMQAAEFIKNSSVCAVLNGDAPLITAEAIRKAAEIHKKSQNSATVITAVLENADGYGRIVRNDAGDVVRIVEHKDADDDIRKIHEINSGMYIFDSGALSEALLKLEPNNTQGEYYLTDTLEIIRNNGGKIGAYAVEDADEIRGINDRLQLSEAETIMRSRINTAHMLAGVTMTQPGNVIIEDGVTIGNDTILDGSVILRSGTNIGSGAYIANGSIIDNSTIGSGARICGSNITNSQVEQDTDILNSVLDSAFVDCGTHVGPFAYLRPKSRIGKNVRVGDFVEVKNSNVGDGTKISHLTYVGDSDVGERVNFGCGTVTSNYDGKNKFRTVIGDDCFIGCNTNLVAPVNVEDGAYIAAGSTITDTVPENSLAIARARQINKEGWTDKRSK